MFIIAALFFVFLVFILYAIARSSSQPRLTPADLALLPAQFVIVDVETTGLSPERHQIIEIGAIKVNRDGNNHQTFQTLVKCKGRLPKKITSITGITKEMLDREGIALAEAMTQFLEFAGDLRLVAYNAPFDIAFLSNAAKIINREIENPVSDALKMAQRAWPRRRSYRLTQLASDGGLSVSGAHRSLKDCHLTLQVYCAASVKLQRIE